jgi:phage host-nuclease inhibitor protein Gam
MKQLHRQIETVRTRGAARLVPLMEELHPLLEKFSLLREEINGELRPLEEELGRCAEEVQGYCEARKGELTADSRTYQIRNGSVQWFLNPKRLVWSRNDLDSIIGALRRLRKLKLFARIKYELRADLLKEHPEIVDRIPELSIEQSERFIINLDEVIEV